LWFDELTIPRTIPSEVEGLTIDPERSRRVENFSTRRHKQNYGGSLEEYYGYAPRFPTPCTNPYIVRASDERKRGASRELLDSDKIIVRAKSSFDKSSGQTLSLSKGRE